ncbi:acyltransferase [Streptomyces capillispiralis]|uniref:Surface polysaccharide O-acyltransferase-like enzyme n=1 Tax=Streptomyces capillispiralis TaxID=68182 RepID=A0A561TEX2_9ACTN|nr:acyltransferase [Streptomyces capillispiralis]TWF85633.1 surface polysaccharide O-acyltransferase-like enzyme [Streptomyces capillispiralis]GHH89952.1 membrane protein [Streptomyces capillispiralis]
MPNDIAVRLPQQQGSAPSGQTAAPREHRFDIDLMRLICSATIMLGHVGAQFIRSTGNDPANGAGSYWAGHLAEAVNPFAVPLYFAIAGWAVLVGAPPRDSARMWQRIVRNIVPLFVWTAVYLVWAWLRDRNDRPMTELAADSVFGSVQPAYHLWFMYAYIPIIALLAFAMLIKAGKRPWGLGAALLGIAVLPSVMTTATEVTGRELPHVAWGFGTYSLVYAVGGALLFALPAGTLRWRWPLYVALPLTMAGALWYNTRIHYVMPNAHLFVAAMSICVLLLVSRVRVPEKWRPSLRTLANAALGAYMVHVLFVEEIVTRFVSPDLSAPAAGLLLAGLVITVMTLSFATSLLWGKLNLRRLLG